MAWPAARFKTAVNGGSWVPADLNGVQDQIVRVNGIGQDDIASATADVLGLSSSTVKRRGHVKNTTSQSIAFCGQHDTWLSMPTPDKITDLVLPTDGFIVVLINGRCAMDSTSNGSGTMTLGLHIDNVFGPAAPDVDGGGAVPPIIGGDVGSPQVGRACVGCGVNGIAHVHSGPAGLYSEQFNWDKPAYTGAVTTGQVFGADYNDNNGNPNSIYTQSKGGPMTIWAAAGTYDLEIKYRHGCCPCPYSGTGYRYEMEMWAYTVGF